VLNTNAFSISSTNACANTLSSHKSPQQQLFASSDYLDDMKTNWEDGKEGEEGREDGGVSSTYLDDLKTNWVESDDSNESPNKSNDDDKSKNLQSLLITASTTDRGQFATKEQKSMMEQLITELESSSTSISNPTESASIQGTWELVYSSTQLFRSSPFFMAGRAVCQTPEEAEQYDWFCDMHRAALAISEIGKVRQVISSDRMVSEFEVNVGSVPFLSDFTPFKYSGGLPFTINGAIVSSADITPTLDGDAWEIFMDTVEIKGSNIPLLRKLLDEGLKLSSRGLGSFLETNVPSYSNPKPIFKTTYLDEVIRISRDQDGKVFVYAKLSDDTEPTDYKGVDADLGLLNLIEGLNDSIFKFSM